MPDNINDNTVKMLDSIIKGNTITLRDSMSRIEFETEYLKALQLQINNYIVRVMAGKLSLVYHPPLWTRRVR